MALDGALANAESLSDLAVIQPVGREAQNLGLA
jgi:hypothetical protein